MLNHLLKQASAIWCALGEDRQHAHLIPYWQDIQVIEAVKGTLKPVAEFNSILSGKQYVTMSSLLPMMQHLARNVLVPDEEGEEPAMTTSIKRSILAKMDHKYD